MTKECLKVGEQLVLTGASNTGRSRYQTQLAIDGMNQLLNCSNYPDEFTLKIDELILIIDHLLLFQQLVNRFLDKMSSLGYEVIQFIDPTKSGYEFQFRRVRYKLPDDPA